MANPSNVKGIMDNWIQKAESEKHCFDIFISLWISFNAYYISETNEQSDRMAVDALKNNNEFRNWYLSIKSCEQISELISVTPIKNIKNGKILEIDRNDFATVLEVIYQIRNNLFHGSKGDHIERDIEVVSAAVPTLKLLTDYCNSNFNKINF